MLRPIVAILAEFNNGRLLQEKGAIRGMRSVAAFAISFLYGLMRQCTLDHLSFCGSLFLILSFSQLHLEFHRIGMTLSAEGFHIPRQKLFLRRGMVLMTV